MSFKNEAIKLVLLLLSLFGCQGNLMLKIWLANSVKYVRIIIRNLCWGVECFDYSASLLNTFSCNTPPFHLYTFSIGNCKAVIQVTVDWPIFNYHLSLATNWFHPATRLLVPPFNNERKLFIFLTNLFFVTMEKKINPISGGALLPRLITFLVPVSIFWYSASWSIFRMLFRWH